MTFLSQSGLPVKPLRIDLLAKQLQLGLGRRFVGADLLRYDQFETGVIDDLLDATAGAEELGKTPGKDVRAGKRTYATETDPAHARQEVQALTEQACEALTVLGDRAGKLRRIARCLARRQR